ncbi:MAG TPA: glutamyl-tRNA reductase, partial [Polyangiales bacterium]|nr:glutamyl-tRNA reductase [Polyangiales bacterium]
MALVAIGLDHNTAGVEVRERLSFTDDEIPTALRRLIAPGSGLLDQAAIMSTCNRVELYGVSRSRPAAVQLASFLARYHGLLESEIASSLYLYRDDQVPHHLAATAAGMRSLVLGESQILGQVRKALQHATRAGTSGVELRRLFESAVAAGRRVRAETAISSGAASVPYACVEFARRRLGTLDHATVVVIGTGEMAGLAARQLAKRGTMQLLVFGRSYTHARSLAESCRGQALRSPQLDEALAQADAVITATCSSQPVLNCDRLRRVLALRNAMTAPLLLVDVSVPRDVDPSAAGLSGVELHTIDDLRATAERTLMRRRDALPE